MITKEIVLTKYKTQIQDRLDAFQEMLNNMSENSRNDAKSSAGDKHETALAMMHIEQEKIVHKINQIIAEKNRIEKIDFQKNSTKVTLGSLVKVNQNYFLVSIALPKMLIQGENVFGISEESPLCQMILNQKIGYEFQLNNTNYTIVEIQ